jgi:outer membrane receptor for ferric coprogen and ferric-rhodotorulic acid
MNNQILKTACALAASAALGNAFAQSAATAAAPASAASAVDTQSVVVTAKRENRVSKGATGLEISIKDTPQTISTIDAEDMKDFGATGSNEALRMGTGINVEQYETNRATFNSRGFDIQLTQLDGLGMTNDWGTVVGQQDTFFFDKIELIRGANGLLTGVGNASGTINYVRKRPTNQDGGEIDLSGGSWNNYRTAIDVNKVLTADGSWAARVMATHEDGDSYLRALHNNNTNLYGVVDGQIGEHGVLTLGASYENHRQKDPMWGGLVLAHDDGSQASFDVSTSAAQDWTYWNTKTRTAFVEYTHDLGAGWEAKFTYNHHDTDGHAKLFYIYGTLENMYQWAYASHDVTHNDIVDANVHGRFDLFGRKHEVMAGVTRSRAFNVTDLYNVESDFNQELVDAQAAYAGSIASPAFGAAERGSTGNQTLTRLYGVTRLALTDKFKAILGVNAVRLHREGTSIYGSGGTVTDPNSQKVSPYAGLTYDITPNALAYVSYSDIFQNQDQTDQNGLYLAPVKGVNVETGAKAEWLGGKLLTTFALFQAQERGLATYGGLTDAGNYWYYAEDKKSKGFEAEVTGRVSDDAKVTLGFTHIALLGPDGHGTDTWVPRNTANFRVDSRVAALPALRLGVEGRWQSVVAYGTHQGGYLLANGFAAWEVSPKATVRLNIDNLLNKKYLTGVENGAGFYGAPTHGTVALEYKL